jgi:hypothetical protein
MHLAVTFLVLQVFLRGKPWFLALAMVDELIVNGLVVSLSEAGVANGWLALISIVLGAANFYLLFQLKAFDLQRWVAPAPPARTLPPKETSPDPEEE